MCVINLLVVSSDCSNLYINVKGWKLIGCFFIGEAKTNQLAEELAMCLDEFHFLSSSRLG